MKSISPRVRTAGALVAFSLLAAGCDTGVADPFVVDGDGSVEGLVFFDANGDGAYDPSAGDVALPNVQVNLLLRGTQESLAGGSTSTGSNGRFELNGIPVGTHDLLIVESSAPDSLTFCQNPIPVSVFLNETQFADLDAERSCLITIAEAEAEPLGSFVTVSGIITSPPGDIRGSYTHIQDTSGGIRIFESSLESQGLEFCDRIEVSGTLAEFGGDFQLTGVTVNEVEKNAAEPQPELVTTAQIVAAGLASANKLLGEFVRVENAELVGDFGTGGLNFRNGLIDTGDGRAQIRLEGAVAADDAAIDALFTLGKCYDIVGVLGAFNGAGQLFPRTTADIVEVACQ